MARNGTPLHYAIEGVSVPTDSLTSTTKNNHVDTIKLLLKNGADINAAYAERSTSTATTTFAILQEKKRSSLNEQQQIIFHEIEGILISHANNLTRKFIIS